MIELWIPLTIAAAFLQNLRSTLQKHLKNVMGTTGATFVRFGFGVPVALIYWLILVRIFELPLPELNHQFALWLVIGSTAQIIATFLLVYLFSFRNFTVGNAYSRTEALQTAIFAFIFFGTQFNAGTIISICIAVIGVMAISVARTKLTMFTLFGSVFSKTALIGLAAGAFFGMAAIGFQQAARSVISDHFIMSAATTLIIGLCFQTIIMLIYMALFDRAELGRILTAWKPAVLVGFVGATATFGWFSAFTLQQAAIVKVLAQVEMLFSFASSYFFFREHINRLEIIGSLLIVISIIVLLLAT